ARALRAGRARLQRFHSTQPRGFSARGKCLRMTDDGYRELADLIEGGDDATLPPAVDDIADFAGAPAPPKGSDWPADATLAECAGLDESDTDNGKRLIRYFGDRILVMQQAGIDGGDFLTWSGRHWDLDGGAAGAALLAQRVGDLIQRETDYMV